MCLSIPGKVVSVSGNKAVVDVNGVTTDANLDLLENVTPGDYVLLHTGYAIQKYDPDEAEKTLELFREIFRNEGLQST